MSDQATREEVKDLAKKKGWLFIECESLEEYKEE